jgi:hypothetical protein
MTADRQAKASTPNLAVREQRVGKGPTMGRSAPVPVDVDANFALADQPPRPAGVNKGKGTTTERETCERDLNGCGCSRR